MINVLNLKITRRLKFLLSVGLEDSVYARTRIANPCDLILFNDCTSIYEVVMLEKRKDNIIRIIVEKL